MVHEAPDHHDADLVLKLYELRREPVMRESRKQILAEFWPKKFDDLIAVIEAKHPLYAAFRQTSSYWEMAYSMARYGIVNPDFLVETTGEGLMLFARVHPFLEQFRKARTPREFINAEWIATNCELGRQVFATMKERVAKRLGGK